MDNKKSTHKMPDGTIHTGKTHTASSRPVKQKIKLMKIIPASNAIKKYTAYFMVNGREKAVSFGQRGARDYVLMNDKKSTHYVKSKTERDKVKAAYIKRHSKENQTNPMKPATLSRFISWSAPSFGGAIRNYKNKFKLN